MLVIMKSPKKIIWMIKPTLITFPPFSAVLALTSIPAPVSLQYRLVNREMQDLVDALRDEIWVLPPA